jgi:hypothetical protein
MYSLHCGWPKGSKLIDTLPIDAGAFQRFNEKQDR